MPYRIIEIHVPQAQETIIEKLLEKKEESFILDVRKNETVDQNIFYRILLPTENTSKFLDQLETAFSSISGFRVNLLPVLASLPRPKEKEVPDEKDKNVKVQGNSEETTTRISREEVYATVSGMAGSSSTFLILVILSTVVAAIGLIKSSVAVIIGAMVIAPLLGPNVALALATTLGDFHLASSALRTNLLGAATALTISLLLGISFSIDPNLPELLARTKVDFGDIGLALASGIAGTLSLTMGVPTMLVGVMVAVALLPPLATFGLMIGSGNIQLGLGALLLLLVNVISVNLAGVATFLMQGIRPLRWWEAERAKKATRNALLTWGILLIILTSLVMFSQ